MAPNFGAQRRFSCENDLNEPKAFSAVMEDVFTTKLECEKFRI